VSVRTEGAATGDLVQGTTFARQMVTSYVDVVNTALVLDPVIDELGLDTTVAGLASRVTATTPLNTVLIDISVTDGDPKQAAEITNAIAESFAGVVQSTLEQPAAEGASSPVTVTVTEPAVAPSSPSAPNVRMLILLGG
ncbi:YveK family protein, partial [Clavibacter michiganensis]|uniref:YveK family protein n=1 Tax=Clavibacter michiganensis TaxID=28447 RepID=UPI00374E11A7